MHLHTRYLIGNLREIASKVKKVQWQNVVQNHQKGEPFPVLDPKVKGYEPAELYKWEMCVQFHLQGTSEKVPTMDIGDKVRSLIVKLQKAHRKEEFLIFMEDGKLIQLKTFPKKMNKFFRNTIIFKSLKDTMVCIGHLTNINPFQISRMQYQEHINLLMEVTVQEKVGKDAIYCKLFNMTVEHAKFDIQLQLRELNTCYKIFPALLQQRV
eukprot:15340646-Ditylum_brightwellii.AAC.1